MRNVQQTSSTQPISQQSSGAQRPRRQCRAALCTDSYITAGSYPSEVFVPGAAGEMLTFNKYLRKLAPIQPLSRRLPEPWVSSGAWGRG